MKTFVLENKITKTSTLLPFIFILLFSFFLPTVQAQTGRTLNFDGVNDHVTIPNTQISGSYTKEAWINIPAIDAAYYAHNIVSGSATSFYTIQGHLGAGHNFNDVQDPAVLSANTWYHVAVTFDDATDVMALYKNGVLVASGAANNYTETTNYIGALYNGTVGYFFNGTIDEVRIWNVARSAEEISNSYECSLDGNEPGLIAYFAFNQGNAGGTNSGVTTLIDSLDTNPNNGTLVNFALTGAGSNWVAPGAPLNGICSVLPIEISNFDVKQTANGVALNWTTSVEINNEGFNVQRSANGVDNWKSLHFISGNGTTSIANNYSYLDLSPVSGNNYYRLKQVDFDGNVTYSNIKVVNFAGSRHSLFVYPTIARNKITITNNDKSLLNTPVFIIDVQGRVVQKELLTEMKQSINISLLQKGIYYLKVQNGQTEKFIKQ